MSTSPQVTPQRILATLQAYRDAAALNTAIELELFTRIAHGADTPGKIAGELDIPVRGVRLLCEYLAVAGLLEKEDEQLKVTDEVAQLLDKESPGYVGNAARALYSPALLHGYERLTEAVIKGTAAGTEGSSATTRPEWYDPARGLIDMAGAARAFAENVNLPTGQPLKILDIGARDGAFGIALALRYPDSVVVALDCPEALRVAQSNADAARLGTRYQNIPGDPLLATYGMEYDAVLIAGNFFRFNAVQISSLLMRVHHAVKKTGQVAILEFLSDSSPEFVRDFAGFRLNVLAGTSRGDAYSLADVKGLLESCDYRSVEARAIPAACATLVTARP